MELALALLINLSAPPCGPHFLPAAGPQSGLAAAGMDVALHRTRWIQGREGGPGGMRTPWQEGAYACQEWRPWGQVIAGAFHRQGQRRFTANGTRSVPVSDRTGPLLAGRVHVPLGSRGSLQAAGATPGQALAHRSVYATRSRSTYGADAPSSLTAGPGPRLTPSPTPELAPGSMPVLTPSATVEPQSLRSGELQELAAILALGPLYLWGGRRAPGYGVGNSGGIILSGQVSLDGVGVGSRAPGRLPGRAAGLGEWSFQMLVGRMADNGEIGRPGFLAGRWVWAPIPSLEAGFNRGAFFGGDGAPGMTARRLVSLLFGAHHREDGRVVQMTNQTASFDFSFRHQVAGVPTLVYGELGFEDSSGAWKRSPAIILGVEAAHPDRSFRLGLERSYFSRRNGHGHWYRHSFYRSGWSDRGQVLGHPLAGAGTEWLLHGVIHGGDELGDGAGSSLQVGLRTRERLAEQSFAPAQAGRSWGGQIHGTVPAVPGRELPVHLVVHAQGDWLTENGEPGQEPGLQGTVSLGLQWTFGGGGPPAPP